MPMDPFGLHHNQDMMSSHVTLESMLVGSKAGGADQESKVDNNKKANRPADEALKCPRCDSSNTKFCYYNNYSLTQPRYFCKSCRRYWTKGGTLRNVPVGGGCRKNKRSSSSKIRTTHQDHTPNPLNLLSCDDNSTADLSLAFATLQNGQLGFDHDHIPMLTNINPHGSSFYDASRCGFVEPPPITSSLNNMYYGGENFENVGHVMMSDQEIIGNMPYEDLISSGEIVTSHVKLEGCGDGGACSERADGDDGMVFCGNPWEIGGGEDVGGSSNNNFMGDVGRQSSWINGLHWHGPLNTPLM